MDEPMARGSARARTRQREELRKLDPAIGISLPTSSTQAVAGSLSGLVEQQAWFMRAMLLAAFAKAR
jgi:hypothetical protein